MPGGRKSKYTPELVQRLCDAIAETGREEDGYKAVGISSAIFYRWKSQKVEFVEKVETAKARFRASSPPVLRSLALERLKDFLENNAVEIRETWKKHRVSDDHPNAALRDDDGWLVEYTYQRIRRPCPPTVVERVLGKTVEMPVMQAVQLLLNEGILSPAAAAVVRSHMDEMMAELKQCNDSESFRAMLEAQIAKTGKISGRHPEA